MRSSRVTGPGCPRDPHMVLPSMARASSPVPCTSCQRRSALSISAGSRRMSKARIVDRLGGVGLSLSRRTSKYLSTRGLWSWTQPLMLLSGSNSARTAFRNSRSDFYQCRTTPPLLNVPDTSLYVGYVPGFPSAHSQGESLEELNDNTQGNHQHEITDQSKHDTEYQHSLRKT